MAISVRALEDFHCLSCQDLRVSPVPHSALPEAVWFCAGCSDWITVKFPLILRSTWVWMIKHHPSPQGARQHSSRRSETWPQAPGLLAFSFPASQASWKRKSTDCGLFSCPVHAGWASFPPEAWESGGGRGRWKGSPKATFSLSLPSILCQYLWSVSPVTYYRLSVRHCLAAYHLSVYLFLMFCGKKLPGGHLEEERTLFCSHSWSGRVVCGPAGPR